MQKIFINNTLTGKKELLKPLEDNHIKMYACGVTVYDDCHVGHAMQAIYFDVIRHYLEYAGYKVTYVRNYTDVDDKIIDKAAKLGISPHKLSEDVIASTREDMKSIGVSPASFEPKVSESIPEIIAMTQTLVDKGFAYATEAGDVYYSVRKKENYGKLSNRNLDDLRSETRKAAASDKQDPHDFALWKHDTTPDASWDSPWGKGRPGWHIECSAMAKKFLGDSFDIHGGGRDLVFPHHENEIAQSEAANGCDYATSWIHSGLVTIDKQKMSKSLGNHISIKDFLTKWPAEVLRLSYLERSYGSNIDFSDEVFRQSRCRLLYFYETLEALSKNQKAYDEKVSTMDGFDPEKEKALFHKAMSDDFNTAKAVAQLGNLFKIANQVLKKKNSDSKNKTLALLLETIKELSSVFNLFKDDASQAIASLKKQLLPELGITEDEINTLIAERKTARENKDWTKSDEARDKLLARGIVLKDDVDKTTWTVPHSV